MLGLSVIDVRLGCTEVEQFTCGVDVAHCVTGGAGGCSGQRVLILKSWRQGLPLPDPQMGLTRYREGR